jgi:hypothetical protein
MMDPKNNIVTVIDEGAMENCMAEMSLRVSKH